MGILAFIGLAVACVALALFVAIALDGRRPACRMCGAGRVDLIDGMCQACWKRRRAHRPVPHGEDAR
jgi:hypothetical protein